MVKNIKYKIISISIDIAVVLLSAGKEREFFFFSKNGGSICIHTTLQK